MFNNAWIRTINALMIFKDAFLLWPARRRVKKLKELFVLSRTRPSEDWLNTASLRFEFLGSGKNEITLWKLNNLLLKDSFDEFTELNQLLTVNAQKQYTLGKLNELSDYHGCPLSFYYIGPVYGDSFFQRFSLRRSKKECEEVGLACRVYEDYTNIQNPASTPRYLGVVVFYSALRGTTKVCDGFTDTPPALFNSIRSWNTVTKQRMEERLYSVVKRYPKRTEQLWVPLKQHAHDPLMKKYIPLSPYEQLYYVVSTYTGQRSQHAIHPTPAFLPGKKKDPHQVLAIGYNDTHHEDIRIEWPLAVSPKTKFDYEQGNLTLSQIVKRTENRTVYTNRRKIKRFKEKHPDVFSDSVIIKQYNTMKFGLSDADNPKGVAAYMPLSDKNAMEWLHRQALRMLAGEDMRVIVEEGVAEGALLDLTSLGVDVRGTLWVNIAVNKSQPHRVFFD